MYDLAGDVDGVLLVLQLVLLGADLAVLLLQLLQLLHQLLQVLVHGVAVRQQELILLRHLGM